MSEQTNTRRPHPVTLGMHDAQIMQMRKDGHNLLHIGSELGCNRERVRLRLEVLQGIRPAPKKSGRPLHDVTLGKLDAELLLMIGQGLSPFGIGLKLKCSETTVMRRLEILRSEEA